LRSTVQLPVIASWVPGAEGVAADAAGLTGAARRVREPCLVVQASDGRVGAAFGHEPGSALVSAGQRPPGALPVLGALPALWPELLGDRSFAEAHGCRFPYVVGEMANGIATARMVIAAHGHGLLGFFGAAGLPPARIEAAIDEIEAAIGAGGAWGANLIHSPHEPDLEDAVVDLFLRRGVQRVSASAYMELTPMVVRYAATGLRLDADGRVVRRNRVFAKVSRPEVAARFLDPAPPAILEALVRAGHLTAEEARIAARIPVATDITVEADSGGHTDNQALPAVFPTVQQLRDERAASHGYEEPIRVGAAGGLGTPGAVAAAFAMGAAYVLTGSVNQSAVESGLSERGKALLAQARLGDVMMAPAADMFEMGVKVQVLKRGTLFATRAHKLYDVYRNHPSLEAIPAEERARLERDILGGGLDEVWASTRAFFEKRNPAENDRAERDPKHKMALVFRAYLGQASKWAIAGDERRALDFQIWCGPAMGAFNAWVKGSFLEPLAARTVGQIGLNLLEGAAVITRAQQLRTFGAAVPERAFQFSPRPLALDRGTAGAGQESHSFQFMEVA
jgi:trans-AT polyketide synthase, acyltransferase and oxidoreductase domains